VSVLPACHEDEFYQVYAVGGTGGDGRVDLGGLVVLLSRWSTGVSPTVFPPAHILGRLGSTRTLLCPAAPAAAELREAIAMSPMTLLRIWHAALRAGSCNIPAARGVGVTFAISLFLGRGGRLYPIGQRGAEQIRFNFVDIRLCGVTVALARPDACETGRKISRRGP